MSSSEPPMTDADDDILMDLLTYTCPFSGTARTVGDDAGFSRQLCSEMGPFQSGKISQHQHTTLDSGIFFGGLRGMNPFELNPNPRSQHVLSSSLLAFCRSCTNLRPYQNERAQDADNPDQQNSDQHPDPHDALMEYFHRDDHATTEVPPDMPPPTSKGTVAMSYASQRERRVDMLCPHICMPCMVVIDG